MIPIKALAPFRRGCRSVAEAGVVDNLQTTPGPSGHPLPRKGAWAASSGFDTNGKPFSGFDDTDKSDFHARLVTEPPVTGR